MSVHVTLAVTRLHTPSCHSLKDKRQIIKSLLATLHERFNVSAAEVADQELWQSAVIAIAAVANDAGHRSKVMQACITHIESDPRVSVISVDAEEL